MARNLRDPLPERKKFTSEELQQQKKDEMSLKAAIQQKYQKIVKYVRQKDGEIIFKDGGN